MEHKNMTLDGGEYLLDGNSYIGCTFRNCVMTFKGTEGFVLDSNRFEKGVKWNLDGPALRTVQFLGALYGMGGPGKELVDNLFKSIRQAKQ